MKKVLLPRVIEMLDLVLRGAHIPDVNATRMLLENQCSILVEPDVEQSRAEDREAQVQQRGSTIYMLRVEAGTWQHHLYSQIGPGGVRKTVSFKNSSPLRPKIVLPQPRKHFRTFAVS